MRSNKARGVTYVDRLTRQVKEVRGKTVILCAQALESTRILLNSSTREYPNGLANSSGALGRYLMDHVTGAGASGHLPEFNPVPNANEPQRPNGIYIPRFRNTPSGGKHSRFLRGYGFQGGADAEFNFNAEGYGTSLKTAVKQGVYAISLGAFGESLARWDNYCEIDRDLKDAWGIPALRITMIARRQRSRAYGRCRGHGGRNARSDRCERYPRASKGRNARHGHPRTGDRPHGQ